MTSNVAYKVHVFEFEDEKESVLVWRLVYENPCETPKLTTKKYIQVVWDSLAIKLIPFVAEWLDKAEWINNTNS